MIVPIRAVRAAIALAFGVERTDVWSVALIVRFCPRELLQHLPSRRRRSTVIQLVLGSSKLHNVSKQALTDSKDRGTYLGLLILCIVLAIDVARRRLVRHAQRRVPHLSWEMVLEVEETRLAHVARLGAGLADHRRLEAHACTWVPAEDGEGARACSAFPSELLLGLLWFRTTDAIVGKVSLRKKKKARLCAPS